MWNNLKGLLSVFVTDFSARNFFSTIETFYSALNVDLGKLGNDNEQSVNHKNTDPFVLIQQNLKKQIIFSDGSLIVLIGWSIDPHRYEIINTVPTVLAVAASSILSERHWRCRCIRRKDSDAIVRRNTDGLCSTENRFPWRECLAVIVIENGCW